MALSSVVTGIFNVEKCCDIEMRRRSLKVIESGIIRQIVYGFLLLYLGNFVPKTHRFLRYSTLKPLLGVTQGHQK